MSQFDWHTEDDAVWNEPVQPPQRPSSEPPKRPWPLILFVVLALAAAGWIVYRQVNQQLQSATTAVQEDILATHNLVQTAVAHGDLELFRSQLSGRDPVWTETEEALLENDLVAGRAFWGWQGPEAAPDPTLELDDFAKGTAAINLAPDLNAAELRFPQSYVVTTAPGITETVTLTQTAVYRRGSGHWLLSPPDDAFWGGWVTNEGETVKLVYPERDTAVAERLAVDLESMLHELCRHWPDLNCPADLQLTVRLDTDPESLLAAAGGSFAAERQTLHLPAPTLLGLAGDEAGYQALYRAYGGQVATAVIANLVGWECCQHAPFFQVLTDYLLSGLDLRPWPITAADHTRVLRDSVSMSDLNAFWDRQDWVSWQNQDGWELYTAVDFLLQTYPEIAPVTWLRDLESSRNLLGWVNAAFASQTNQPGYGVGMLDALDEKWWQFAYSQTLLAQERAPLPTTFPDEELQITCMNNSNFDATTATTLYRYNLQAETWTEVLSRTTYLLVAPMLNDSGLVLQSFDFADDNKWETELWRSGQSQVMFANQWSLTLGQSDPTGRYLVVYTGSPETETPLANLVDLASCAGDTCEFSQLIWQPLWSPDGRATIVATNDLFQSSDFYVNGRMTLVDPNTPPVSTPLQLGDAQGQVLAESEAFATGYSPFWTDDRHVGYVRSGATGDEVVVASVEDLEPQVVLTLADLTAVSPSGIHAPATIRYVITHPAQPDLLIVVALDALSRQAYIFSYDLAAEQLDLRLQSPVWPSHALGFSPDGRWLVLTGSTPDQNNTRAPANSSTIYLHNIASHQTQTYISQFASSILTPMFDWSADSQWLVFIVDDRILSLVAPDFSYQWVFAHDEGNCMDVSWVN